MRERKGNGQKRELSTLQWGDVVSRLNAISYKLGKDFSGGCGTARGQRGRERRVACCKNATGQSDAPVFSYLEFLLGRRRYGIETEYVGEVLPLRGVFCAPPAASSPAHVVGIVQIRGSTFQLTDLKKLLRLPQENLINLDKIIVIEGRDSHIAVLVDATAGFQAIHADSIQPALSGSGGAQSIFIKGITSEKVMLLNPEAFLSCGIVEMTVKS